MNTGQQLELGFRTYFRAIGFIFSNGLWWTFVFPVLLNVLLFIGGYTLIESITGQVQTWIQAKLGSGNDSFFLAHYLGSFLTFFAWFFFRVLFFFVFAYFGGYIVLILLSPLFAYLSAATEKIISGKKYPFDGDQWMRDMVRGIIFALRNLIIFSAWMILLFIVGFIPVIGWLGVIVLFIISAYFYGFAFMDYICERRRMKIRDSIQFVRANKWLAVANGSVFCLFLLLPLCGVLLSGFAAIVSVVAATLAVNELFPIRE
jgi:CysZ protein